MGNDLTARQQAVLKYIVRYIKTHGYPPTIREIRSHLGIKSLRGVTVHLEALERKGYIQRYKGSRSIRVLKSPKSEIEEGFVKLPLVGTIAAGTPRLAFEHIEAEVPVPASIAGRGSFLLRVRGDSMIDAHIMDGDLVVVKPQHWAENGDLVVALIGDEATVKRLRVEGEKITLVPANRAYSSIPLEGAEAKIIGKVVGLLREY
jgi:repressor LexA